MVKAFATWRSSGSDGSPPCHRTGAMLTGDSSCGVPVVRRNAPERKKAGRLIA